MDSVRRRSNECGPRLSVEWLELSVEAPPEFVEPLSHVFLRYGNGGVAVEEEDGYLPDEGELPGQRRATIRTYMPLDASAAERRGRIDVAVRLVAALAPVSDLAERVLPEEQWRDAWKKHFKPLKIGRRVVVRPTWSADKPAEGEATIWLDPGMAFGTGHHPTTRMCIEQIERTMTPGAARPGRRLRIGNTVHRGCPARRVGGLRTRHRPRSRRGRRREREEERRRVQAHLCGWQPAEPESGAPQLRSHRRQHIGQGRLRDRLRAGGLSEAGRRPDCLRRPSRER